MELVAELKGHADRVWAVSWSPQGELASCAGDGAVKIWSQADGEWKCTATMKEHGQTVRSVSWSHKGDLLACASFDKSASICQKTADGWAAVASLEAHENEVKAVAFSRFDNCIATCSRDKSVAIWEESTENQDEVDYECAFITNSGGHSQDVKYVAWHPKHDILVSCSYDDTVKIWREDPEQKDDWYCMQTLHGHSSTVWMGAWSPEGDMLATCSDDKTVIIWKSDNPASAEAEWRKACVLAGQHTRTIYAVDWANESIATACGDDTVRVFTRRIDSDPMNLGFDVQATVPQAHTADVNSVKWSHDGELLASCSDDGMIKVWRIKSA